MRQSGVVVMCMVALVTTACGVGSGPRAGASPTASASETSPVTDSPAADSPAAPAVVPLCKTVARISAPADRYRDSPIYVANEMPTDEIRAWAAGKPGFEEMWIDRDHLGWITVAFSADADARQAELEAGYPDVGVVATHVDWTMSELEDLQRRVSATIAPLFPLSSGISVTQGVVTIGLGVLHEERIAAIEERFAGERVCIEGADPADVPSRGPQAQQGDGWRLLADEQGVGEPYRTGIAWDQASYRRLWVDVGLSAERPPMDFGSEVVIWFGAVFGSSCPSLRLDDVVVDHEQALIHADIVLVDPPAACTDDANPRAYLVSIERGSLPTGPFSIQLDADDPPAGAPEERTLVDVDLSRPGAVAGPGDVHGDPALPEPFILESGSFIEPGYGAPYRLYAHCGIEWLGRVNDIAWRTGVPAGSLDFIPPEWRTAVDPDESIEVSIILRTDPRPVIEATANDHKVIYRPTQERPPGCD